MATRKEAIDWLNSIKNKYHITDDMSKEQVLEALKDSFKNDFIHPYDVTNSIFGPQTSDEAIKYMEDRLNNGEYTDEDELIDDINDYLFDFGPDDLDGEEGDKAYSELYEKFIKSDNKYKGNKETGEPDKSSDKTPDDPDESSDKPHDKELAGETTPEEDFMQRAVEGKIPATSGVLAGDLTPEEIEMIRMMRAKKQAPKKNAGLAGETTPEEDEMLKLASSQTLSDERFKNITNRLAKSLSKHRW